MYYVIAFTVQDGGKGITAKRAFVVDSRPNSRWLGAIVLGYVHKYFATTFPVCEHDIVLQPSGLITIEQKRPYDASVKQYTVTYDDVFEGI